MNFLIRNEFGLTLIEVLIGLVIVFLIGALVYPEAYDWYCSYQVEVLKNKVRNLEESVQRCAANHDREKCFNLETDEYVSKFESDLRNNLTVTNVKRSDEVKRIVHENVGCRWTDSRGNTGNKLIYDTLSGEFLSREQ